MIDKHLCQKMSMIIKIFGEAKAVTFIEAKCINQDVVTIYFP